MIVHTHNPDAHETLAIQYEAEADAHEESARMCRTEAIKERLTAWYLRVVSQLPPVK